MSNDKSILLGAVAYDPKVVTIWEGIRKHFQSEGVALDFALFSNYERQVELPTSSNRSRNRPRKLRNGCVEVEVLLSLVNIAQPQNRKRFYERDVKKKVSPRPPKVLGS